MGPDSNTATFVSPTNDLRLVKEPIRRRQVGETGEFINVPGQTFEFQEGLLTINPDQPRYRNADDGEALFREDLEFLREHVECGRLFHERGNEPDRPVENSAAVQARIVELAFDGNVDEIARILLAERTTYSRPEVIAACETAINRAGGVVPARPATPEHELERVRLAGGQPLVEPAVAAGQTAGGSPAAWDDPTGGLPQVEGQQAQVQEQQVSPAPAQPVPEQPGVPQQGGPAQ